MKTTARICMLLLVLPSLSWSAERAAMVTGDQQLSARAQLTPRRYTSLAAEISARVSRVHVLEGGFFREGDLLLSFDSTIHRAQLERTEAVLAAAEKMASANQRLLELKSVGQIEAENAVSDFRKARAEVTLAAAMLSKCEIRAPFSGRVAEQKVREQEFVQAGQVLLEVLDDAVPQIDFIVPSKWLLWLRTGLQLTLRVDETGKSYEAKVERIGARVDPVSQSVKVVAALNIAAPELIAGMSGMVFFHMP